MNALIIIGAPRSGTNMLRRLACALPGCGTWPCDEINFIWRHGNVDYPSDVLPAHLATTRVGRFIRGRFAEIARSYGLTTVVEKTCANSLRVPFVDRIVPEAKYIFLVRNGADAVASAVKRWRAGIDLPYTLRKARFVPWTDVPRYALRFLSNRLFRFVSGDRRLAQWGPRLDGMDTLLRNYTLEEVCAFQWRECVLRSEEAFSRIGEDRVLRARYEEVVVDPVGFLRRAAAFLDLGSWTPAPEIDSWVVAERAHRPADTMPFEVRQRVHRVLEGVEPHARPVSLRCP